MSHFERAQLGMLGGIALAAPLQGYSYVPYLDVSFSALLLLGMVVLWTVRWRSNPVRMPVEYWWPAIGVLLIAGWFDVFFEALAPMLAFVLGVQYVRSRLRAEFMMWLVVNVLGVYALLNAFSHNAELLPTAHSYYNEATFVGAYSVSHGVLLLLVGLLWSGYITLGSKLSPGLRTSSFFSGFFCLGVLAGKLFLLRGHVYDWSESIAATGSGLLMVAAGLFAWLTCRIVAKLWVTREESTPLVVVLGGTVLLMAAYWALFPADFAVYPGVILGLAAGYALPDREETPADSKFPFVSAALIVALVFVNVAQPYPENDRDGRNVNIVLERDWERGTYDRVHRYASNLALVYPDATGELLAWMAQASVATKRYERASKELAMAGAALSDDASSVLTERLDIALIELRDAVSQSERANASFAYERALVGLGERGSALAVLKMKVDSGLVNLPESWSRESKAFVYAALLGDVSLEEEIATWNALVSPMDDSLWEGIVTSGGIDASLFWIVDRWPDRCVLYAVLGERMDLSERALTAEWLSGEIGFVAQEDFVLRADEDPERGDWVVAEADGIDFASFRLEEGRLVRTSLGETDLERLPYDPVIRLQTAESR